MSSRDSSELPAEVDLATNGASLHNFTGSLAAARTHEAPVTEPLTFATTAGSVIAYEAAKHNVSQQDADEPQSRIPADGEARNQQSRVRLAAHSVANNSAAGTNADSSLSFSDKTLAMIRSRPLAAVGVAAFLGYVWGLTR